MPRPKKNLPMREKKDHDLFDFMSQVSAEIASEYQRIQNRATEDPGTAGDQGEENWAQLLRDWLPPTYSIVTKGRIISHLGDASPQVDVLVLKPSYPHKLRNKKLYLAAGVAAAFECKTTLRSHHIAEAAAACIEIKKLYSPRSGSPYAELRSPVIYGLLAHSHAWKNSPELTVDAKLQSASEEFAKHPKEELDLLCVSDLGTWHALAMSHLPHLVGTNENSVSTCFVGSTIANAHQRKGFSPAGSLLNSLMQKLAWEDASMRAIADYYRLVNIAGAGVGTSRPWPFTIYSDEVRYRVLNGGTVSGDVWNEWNLVFT